MPKKIAAENLLSNLMETLADNNSNHKSMSFFEEEQSNNSVTTQFNRLFGRQKPVHHLLGGGKSADVMLWRDKKKSAGVLTTATAIWTIFEWLNYHVLTLVCFALIFGMIAQFVWSNASVFFNSGRSSPRAPRIVLPDELFVNIARTVGAEVNRALRVIQDVSCGGSLKQFLMVILSLWAAAVVGSWCDFLTVIYTGFVGAHTLPVMYEKYEDDIDKFIYKILGNLQDNYRKMDSGLLSKIPRGRKGKKHN